MLQIFPIFANFVAHEKTQIYGISLIPLTKKKCFRDVTI